jgi:hypothetical protein
LMVELIRKPTDGRSMTIAVPYEIRVKDPCWARKWGDNHVVGNRWEGGSGDSKGRIGE